jgi:hypothetical protein
MGKRYLILSSCASSTPILNWHRSLLSSPPPPPPCIWRFLLVLTCHQQCQLLRQLQLLLRRLCKGPHREVHLHRHLLLCPFLRLHLGVEEIDALMHLLPSLIFLLQLGLHRIENKRGLLGWLRFGFGFSCGGDRSSNSTNRVWIYRSMWFLERFRLA